METTPQPAEPFPWRDGELLAGGCLVRELAKRYQTPLFVYDGEVAGKKWSTLRAALPARFEICYSMKANPQPAFFVEGSRDRNRVGRRVVAGFGGRVQTGESAFRRTGQVRSGARAGLAKRNRGNPRGIAYRTRTTRKNRQEIGQAGSRGLAHQPQRRSAGRRDAHGRQARAIRD